MVLSREAHSGAVAGQVAVLQVNDSLAYQVIGSEQVTVPHLHCQILVQWQRSCHLKDTGEGRQDGSCENVAVHVEEQMLLIHSTLEFKPLHSSFIQ